MTIMFGRKSELPTSDSALTGRAERPYSVGDTHAVTGNALISDGPAGHEIAVFGLGCFWGEERTYWEIPGVWSTTVGYAGGITPHPTYDEVCSGRTGHAEVVRVVYDPSQVTYQQLLQVFWENHDPTQGMRQGNDRGSQYRSIILTTNDEQQTQAEASRVAYQQQMTKAGYGEITTSILPLGEYYYAEAVHQQYLARNPYGYCPLHATGVEYV